MSISSIVDFLTELLRFVSDIFSHRTEDRKNLWAEILDTRAKLAEALAEGRVSDVGILRRELKQLMDRYMRDVKVEERHMRRSEGKMPPGSPMMAIGLAASLILAGCKSDKPQTVFVLGDRINVLQPGTELTVPELQPPAKVWYLVDNVAIQSWLDIPVDFETKGGR